MSSKTAAANCNDISRSSTRTRASSSRKCCACQCQPTSQESSRPLTRKRTSTKPKPNNNNKPKPKTVGPATVLPERNLPGVARAKSSVQHRKPATTVSAVAVAVPVAPAVLQQVASSRVRSTAEIPQRNRTQRIRKTPAVPSNNATTTVKTATPRQIWRKKLDAIPSSSSSSKLKKPAVSELLLHDSFPEDSDSEHHITWDGFEETEYRIGERCYFCDEDLAALASTDDNNETEFSTLPVVAMLPCGHAFHVHCLDRSVLQDNRGDPPVCVLCK